MTRRIGMGTLMSMPDDLLPSAEPAPSSTTETAAPSEPVATDAPAEPSAPDVADAHEAIYDDAVKVLLSDGKESEGTKTEAAAPTEQPAPQATKDAAPAQKTATTASEEQVLAKAGLDPEDYAGWPREKIEAKVAKLRSLNQPQTQAQETKAPEPKEKAPPAKGSISEKLAGLKTKLVESYDEDIGPLVDVITEIEEATAPMRQSASMVSVLQEILGELAFESAITGLTKDYPSIEKPEARAKLTERFLTEWNTGAYVKPGTSFRQQIAEAARNAAKVTFNNTTEQSAVASLVQTNKARVLSQPKIVTNNPRATERRGEDVYDKAFQEHLAPELARR